MNEKIIFAYRTCDKKDVFVVRRQANETISHSVNKMLAQFGRRMRRGRLGRDVASFLFCSRGRCGCARRFYRERHSVSSFLCGLIIAWCCSVDENQQTNKNTTKQRQRQEVLLLLLYLVIIINNIINGVVVVGGLVRVAPSIRRNKQTKTLSYKRDLSRDGLGCYWESFPELASCGGYSGGNTLERNIQWHPRHTLYSTAQNTQHTAASSHSHTASRR